MNKEASMIKLRAAIAILSLLSCLACSPSSVMLPRQLEGVWTTGDPRYADAFLELSPTFVIIVTSSHEPARVQFVDRVKVQSEDANTLLTVYSTDVTTRAHDMMILELRPDHGGELRIGHQTQVWTKRPLS
jgi:hypothetical protein